MVKIDELFKLHIVPKKEESVKRKKPSNEKTGGSSGINTKNALKSVRNKYGDVRLGISAAKIAVKRHVKGAAIGVKVKAGSAIDKAKKGAKGKVEAPAPSKRESGKWRRNKKGD